MKTNSTPNLSPWAWIPSLYFTQGIPYVIVMTVAVIMYKRMGLSNTDIALYTSWLYLPWVIKPFWSPFVDIIKTKRWWIISMQLLIGAGLAGIAFLIPTPFYVQATLAVFWLIAFSSATHDIAADGFYMLALENADQSFFVGIRSTFYRLAMISGQGLLIILAGSLESATGLEPLHFSVQSSTSQYTQDVRELPNDILTNNTTKGGFQAFPSNLILNTNPISTDSLNQLTQWADSVNTQNGFIEKIKSGVKKQEESSWWTNHVSRPLGEYIQTHFGEKRNNESLSNENVGNAALMAIRLTQKPAEGKTVVLNSVFASGDKSISVLKGERLEFNASNWEKPGYVVVQLDKKLSKDVSTSFKGTAGNIKMAWSITFFLLAAVFGLLLAYHRFILPRPAGDAPIVNQSTHEIFKAFGETFQSFFRKPGVGIALTFMLLYRLGEAMLVKMTTPFLLDTREIGGLGLTTGQVGIVYGTVGVVALTIGGIVGGMVASHKGLKFWLWPMALCITLPHLAFLYLSWFLPNNMILINLAIALEQFGYGFGFTAYMLYMIYFAEGKHKTAHYAILTGFMAMGMMLPGMIAGWLQEMLGYNHFFIWVMMCAIPTLAVIPFLKIDKNFGKK